MEDKEILNEIKNYITELKTETLSKEYDIEGEVIEDTRVKFIVGNHLVIIQKGDKSPSKVFICNGDMDLLKKVVDRWIEINKEGVDKNV